MISEASVFTVFGDHIVSSLIDDIAIIEFEDVRMVHLLKVGYFSNYGIETA